MSLRSKTLSASWTILKIKMY